MIICFAVGIANIFSFRVIIIIFCGLAMYVPTNTRPKYATTDSSSASSFLILFIEVPLLLRICPTSGRFDAAVRRISTNYMRAAAYGVMSLVQFLSIIDDSTSLIAAAVFLALTGICYLLAAVKGQDFVGSKTLGGHGVAQMIV